MRVESSRAALLDALHERTPRRVGGVDREREPRVGAGPTDLVVELGELAHERREAVGVELGDRAAAGLERVDEPLGFVEQGVDPGLAPPVDERLEVPRDIGRGAVGFGNRHLGLRASGGSVAGLRGRALRAAVRRGRP